MLKVNELEWLRGYGRMRTTATGWLNKKEREKTIFISPVFFNPASADPQPLFNSASADQWNYNKYKRKNGKNI